PVRGVLGLLADARNTFFVLFMNFLEQGQFFRPNGMKTSIKQGLQGWRVLATFSGAPGIKVKSYRFAWVQMGFCPNEARIRRVTAPL
ncbi:hypothetical protein, partial [Litoreibacter albidus]|uniref:hypothetical protein n=1 Tax=Litoreibacter albidus TaxID=670155 RepID=UPI003736502D